MIYLTFIVVEFFVFSGTHFIILYYTFHNKHFFQNQIFYLYTVFSQLNNSTGLMISFFERQSSPIIRNTSILKNTQYSWSSKWFFYTTQKNYCLFNTIKFFFITTHIVLLVFHCLKVKIRNRICLEEPAILL